MSENNEDDCTDGVLKFGETSINITIQDAGRLLAGLFGKGRQFRNADGSYETVFEIDPGPDADFPAEIDV